MKEIKNYRKKKSNYKFNKTNSIEDKKQDNRCIKQNDSR